MINFQIYIYTYIVKVKNCVSYLPFDTIEQYFNYSNKKCWYALYSVYLLLVCCIIFYYIRLSSIIIIIVYEFVYLPWGTLFSLYVILSPILSADYLLLKIESMSRPVTGFYDIYAIVCFT